MDINLVKCNLDKDELISNLVKLEGKFHNLSDQLLEKNNQIDSKLDNERESINISKNSLDKEITNYQKSISKYDSKINEICNEFMVKLDINNVQNINYKVDQGSSQMKINDFIKEADLIFQDMFKEVNEIRSIRSERAEEERKRKEQEELEHRIAHIKKEQAKLKQELERKQLIEEEQKIQAVQEKKKENIISIGSILGGFIIMLIGGLCFSNQYHLTLSSIILITYYAFSLVFGLGFSVWIYKDKLFSNTKLGYKNTLYIHSVCIPIIGVAILYLAVANGMYTLMLFSEISIAGCLLRYWYENMKKFVFIRKFTYKKILICSGVILIFGLFWQTVIQAIIGLIVIAMLIFTFKSKR